MLWRFCDGQRTQGAVASVRSLRGSLDFPRETPEQQERRTEGTSGTQGSTSPAGVQGSQPPSLAHMAGLMGKGRRMGAGAEFNLICKETGTFFCTLKRCDAHLPPDSRLLRVFYKTEKQNKAGPGGHMLLMPHLGG